MAWRLRPRNPTVGFTGFIGSEECQPVILLRPRRAQ